MGDVRHRRRTVLLPSVVVAGCAAVLAVQLHGVDLGAALADVRPAWVAAAVAGFVLSLAAAAHNISAFAPLRLRAVDTLRAQLAIGALRLVAPPAVSTPLLGTRFLVRSGLPPSTALTVVAVAQAAQAVMTVVVVAVIALAASSRALPSLDARSLVAAAAVLVVVAVVVVVLARAVPRVRRAVQVMTAALRSVVAHLRAHPARVASGLAASAALTLAHVAAFVCCVAAVGGHTSLLVLTTTYLAAASAGSLVPTPGGLGPVEATMISGLCAAGTDAATATAAVLLCRLVMVWVPALPGLLALRGLRREGLL